MTRARIPFIAVVTVMLLAAFMVERDQPATEADQVDGELFRAAPLVASADVLGSSWYCAAGSSDAEGPADHTVIIANPTDTAQTAELTAFPGQSEPVAIDVEVPAQSIERVRLADLVEAPSTAAMVEIPGGELAVSHELSGPLGFDSGPCASTTSRVWHFAWGDTSVDARSLVALFNPFPGDAVVDFSFVTIDGSRQPGALTGVVVPGGSVVMADVGAEIARRDQVSTTVNVRAGRVVAERLQIFDDAQELLEGADPRRGITVDLGVPVPMATWIHPSVRFTEGLREHIVIYNPGQATAEVDIEIIVAGVGVEPFELSVRPNSYETIILSDEDRIAELVDNGGVDAVMVVRSLNEVPIVAERVTTVATNATSPGMAASVGSPLIGRTLVVVDPRPSGAEAASMTLVNPDGENLVTGTITLYSREVSRPMDGSGTFELGPAGRLDVDLVDRVSGSGNTVLVIESTLPIAAGVTARVGGAEDRVAFEAIGHLIDAEPMPSELP